jgi:hypothetical protein
MCLSLARGGKGGVEPHQTLSLYHGRISKRDSAPVVLSTNAAQHSALILECAMVAPFLLGTVSALRLIVGQKIGDTRPTVWTIRGFQ